MSKKMNWDRIKRQDLAGDDGPWRPTSYSKPKPKMATDKQIAYLKILYPESDSSLFTKAEAFQLISKAVTERDAQKKKYCGLISVDAARKSRKTS